MFIPTNAKILSISHSDLDGAVCQIILGNVYTNIKFISIGYEKVDSYLSQVSFENYQYVFLTDIHPKDSSLLYRSKKIILIDHHMSKGHIHDPKNHLVVISGVCASELVKRFVEKMYSIRLKHLYNLIYLTNDYDMWLLKNPKSLFLNELIFSKYGASKFRKMFMDGRTRLTPEEITHIRERKDAFKDFWDKLEIFTIEEINGCVIRINEFINDVGHKLLTEEKYDFVFIRNPINSKVHVRMNKKIENLNMGMLMEELKMGGGHKDACGFSVTDDNDFKEKMNIIVDTIKNKGVLNERT